jgi:DNA-directed RNA polymerase specialized sigma24 family protein
MDQLLALCSDTLIARLAGTTTAAPLLQRLHAARVIRACIRELETPYREALSYRLGIDGELLSDEEIAARLHVALAEIDALVDEAIVELGWALVCGKAPTGLDAVAVAA